MSDEHIVEGDFELAKTINCDKPIHCCKFHPIGDIFAVGLSDGSIKIYMKDNFQLIYNLIDNEIRNLNLPVTSIKFNNPISDTNPDHYKILIATYVSGFVKFWHYPSQKCLYTIVDKDIQPLNLDLNLDCNKLAVSGYGNHINIYDIQTKKLINTLESSGTHSIMDGHMSRVFCVKYNPIERNQLFSGGWDDTVHIWDDRIPHSQKHISGPHICGNSIDIDIKHNHLVTGSWRKFSTLQIWDLRTNDIIRDIFENNSNMMIYTCQWLADEYILVGGSDKNAAIIYDRGSLKSVGGLIDLKHAVVCVDNNNNGKVPDMIIASDTFLYYLRKKQDKIFKINKK